MALSTRGWPQDAPAYQTQLLALLLVISNCFIASFFSLPILASLRLPRKPPDLLRPPRKPPDFSSNLYLLLKCQGFHRSLGLPLDFPGPPLDFPDISPIFGWTFPLK